MIPHWAPPTHAMQLWRYVEQGSIDFLWISATNPAVSLPELPRIREILAQDNLFLVVQDGFLTETAQYADVVLPVGMWGEKQGTFTNASRTVHLSEQAVEPPGEARSDLAIFLDYARRMDFRDKDGEPLIATTGRSTYQFHTRTKTGRSRRLRDAAPSVWVELSKADANELGVAEGDEVRVESARGSMVGPARIGEGRDGVVFVPFHYGSAVEPTAANEFTLTEWDPVSKQPTFKWSAVRVSKED
ncbi:molybdopterin oxidoreductase family protein [Kribbella endophytica]